MVSNGFAPAETEQSTAKPALRQRSTSEMIQDCFRHQHPEAYGGEAVPQTALPWRFVWGRDHMASVPASALPEESMGDPDASPLDPE
jgi:hypothetical protein